MEAQDRPRDAEITLILGRRGMGKTSTARALVKGARRLLVWDMFADHADVEYCETWEPIARMVEARPEFRLGLSEPEPDFALTLLSVAYHAGNCTVVLEEVDTVARPGFEPSLFRRAVAQGRHWGLTLIATSRRPAEVSRLLSSQAARIIVFGTQEPRDVAYLRGVIGDAALTLSTLPRCVALDWRYNARPKYLRVWPGRDEVIASDTLPAKHNPDAGGSSSPPSDLFLDCLA